LTQREIEVLELVKRGLTNREIGYALHISPWTVKRHLAELFHKTGLHTRLKLALWFIAVGVDAHPPSPTASDRGGDEVPSV
jgi:DNA-binding NarL/FixJ family response regulator